MFDIGGGELILIILAVIVLFGPKKLPEIMKTAAKGIRQFKKAQADLNEQFRSVKEEVDKEINNLDPDKAVAEEPETKTHNSDETGVTNVPEHINRKFDSYKPIETKLTEEEKNNQKECI